VSKIILIVAAHSDDEAIGCAGTMAKHVAAGDDVHVLFMTDGVSSRLDQKNDIDHRSSSAENASAVIGVKSIENLDFPDNKMDRVPLLDVTQAIERKVKALQPDAIYTHHIGDLNVDHQITHKAVITACRPQPASYVKEIYSFEVLSSTEWQSPGFLPFTPNVFVDISNYIDIKREALEAYSSEMREAPHSRNIDNIIRNAEVRGHAVGVAHAEAFTSLRELK